ncbi:YciI family protein [Rugosimonospora africana]|uniref:YCII-related domain-containing protein n=1 Tax=Rugosimonospora africana TaxID=556532 RepID=A0A8J3QQ18_9ACTN|nr:YciI family protein [Rugosimonospora africana]GIH15360.1 hypothetical protein Raf01_35320 [Rugosimonospora africana]
MKYLMLVCNDPSLSPSPDANPIESWLDEMHSRGVRLEGSQLRPTSDATTVRESGRLVADGPFAETKELVAGYDVIECADLAEAIEVASKHPVATFGAIELRPIWTDE